MQSEKGAHYISATAAMPINCVFLSDQTLPAIDVTKLMDSPAQPL